MAGPTRSSTLDLNQLSSSTLDRIRLIATDMDGTLTQAGKFSAQLLQTFVDLEQADFQVLIVTGRSAGWVSGLATYLPVWGAIAENGGLFYTGTEEPGQLLVPIPDLQEHRQQLAGMFAQLQARFPQICESEDNRFRLTDWTFDVAGLTLSDLREMQEICDRSGWGFTYSTVQCHLKLLQQNKASGVLQVLGQYFPDYKRSAIVTVGDSPNDESLFDPQLFPVSVGVSNVQHYLEQLRYPPTYLTQQAEGAGFCEFIQKLLVNRRSERNGDGYRY